MEKIKNLLTGLILLSLITITGCSTTNQKIDNGGLNPPTELSNPASTYCIEQGGKLRLENTDQGQQGICTLPDGTEIEEWKYYKEHLKTNTTQTPDKLDLSNCKKYYDGCNTCFVHNGEIGGCTRMGCPAEQKNEPKCILYNDQKIIGKITKITPIELHILQGDIIEILELNNKNISQFKLNDEIEATYNQDSYFKNLLFEIKSYTQPKTCSKEYSPVCAKTSDETLNTFDNECMADTNEIIHTGECGKDSETLNKPRACTMEYIPICMEFNGKEKTFPNSCFEDVLTKLYDGECKNENSIKNP